MRSVLVRRLAAGALVVLAAVVTLAERSPQPQHQVLVAAHELRAGNQLTAADLELRDIPATLHPPQALTAIGDAVGRTVTGSVGTGEILTGRRLLSSQLPVSLTGRRDARLVPVRPADPSVSGLLRIGDIVDVLDETGRTLAAGAVVALTPEPVKGSALAGSESARPLLLAMSGDDARRVAVAGLSTPPALVVH